MCGSTNKSSIKLSAEKIKLTRWFVYEWGKPTRQKPPPSDFKVTTSENPLLSQQAVTSKGILVSYTNLQLNPYPNIQLDLFCNDNLSLWCMAPSTWLTNCTDPSTQLQSPTEKVVGYKVFQFIQTMKIKKMLGHKTLQCTNTATSSQERWTRANSVSGHNLLEQTLLNTCPTCVHIDNL